MILRLVVAAAFLTVLLSAQAGAETKVFPRLGSMVIVSRDLGFAPGLRIYRAYNSKTHFNGMVGAGWSLELETHLEVNPDRSVSVQDAGGGEITHYVPAGRHTLRALGSPFDVIIKSAAGYARKLKDGTLERFDIRGRLIRLEDGDSFVDLRYTGFSRISDAVDNLGHSLRFTYDQAGHVTSIQHQGSPGTQYGYDTSGRLVSVRGPDGAETKYAYDPKQRFLLVEAKNADGTLEKFTYFDRDKLQSIKSHVDTRGYKTTYEYEIADRRIDAFTLTIARPDGSVGLVEKSRYAFDQGRLTKSVLESGSQRIETTYDSCCERPVQIVSGTRKTTVAYDSFGRITRYQSGAEETRFTYGKTRSPASVIASGKKAFKLDYDSNDRPRSLTLPSGKKLAIEYDAKGRPRAPDAHGAAELAQGLREIDALAQPLEMNLDQLAENIEAAGFRK